MEWAAFSTEQLVLDIAGTSKDSGGKVPDLFFP